MHWDNIWIVPLIALVLWILSSLIRNTEEQARDRPDRPRPPRPDEPPRLPTEVDKFLQEINRMRRQQAEERRTEPRAEPPPPPVESIPEVVPVEQTAPDFERRRPPVVVAEVPRPERVRPRPVVRVRRPEPRPAPAAPPRAVPVAVPMPPPAPPEVQIHAPRVSAAVPQVFAMLRSPQNVQAAILLQEVLGPPRCRGRRR
jgi:hypothetical protein